jgi:hypothetical protein
MIKLFLSHAFEDKDFVRPLAKALIESGFDVWLDEIKITLGDSILNKVDEGLRSCDYAIMVLSKHFFAKRWTGLEWEALFGLETKEQKLILPIWRDVSVDEVRRFSPILAGRLGVTTDRGVDKVVYEIRRAVGLLARQKGLERAAWKEEFASLNADVTHRRQAEALAGSRDGVRQVTEVAREIIAEARHRVDTLCKEMSAFELKVSDKFSNFDRIFIEGPIRMAMVLSFEALATTSVNHSSFEVQLYDQAAQLVNEFEFLPRFDRGLKVYWQGSGNTWGSPNSRVTRGHLD